MERYRHIDHTADLGMEVYGESLKELFQNAAFGLTDTLVDASAVGASTKREFRVTAANQEELLIKFLGELLYVYDVERILFSSFRIFSLTSEDLHVEVEGEAFDSNRHEVRYDIKAVTYHGARIWQDAERFCAQVIFDL